MSNTLYVFIDESGNPTDGDYYVVSGSWCVSERSSASEVLLPTVEGLRDIADAALHDMELGDELKGESLPTDVLEILFRNLDGVSHEDDTVTQYHVPWGQTTPIRFSVKEVNPNLGLEILNNVFQTPDKSPMTLKTMALVSVLNPIFSDAQLDNGRFDDVRVVLDSTVWQNPAEQIERGIALLDDPPKVELTTAASDAIPGLQIADLAAYSWGRELRHGDCSDAVNEIHNYRFSYRQERR